MANDDVPPARRICALPTVPAAPLPAGLGFDRARAILQGRTKWVDGTVLHYYFFDRQSDGTKARLADGTTRLLTWVGDTGQRDVVRAAFRAWKDLGLGLEFREVHDRSEAEVRIGFQFDEDGSWSFIGRDVLKAGNNTRTMNFGWDLTADDYGMTTALHEIGHTIGLPHEHQNPFAGIAWDEAKVYEYFGGPPNSWDRETTFNNVLRKLDQSEVVGSTWDPDSIMEYAFPAGLITRPARYHDGLRPPGTLSEVDKQYVCAWFPPLRPAGPPALVPFESRALGLEPGGQADFSIEPDGTREYRIATFGASDVVAVLFEEVDGDLRYVAGDDDSGEERNAELRLKLFQGRRYVLRVRLYYAGRSGRTAVMYW